MHHTTRIDARPKVRSVAMSAIAKAWFVAAKRKRLAPELGELNRVV
jgi:hypothetical protein